MLNKRMINKKKIAFSPSGHSKELIINCICHTVSLKSHFFYRIVLIENVATRLGLNRYFQKKQGFRNTKNSDIQGDRDVVTKFTGRS